MDVFASIDTYLFLMVNHLPHSEASNAIALGISGVGQWGAVWIIIAIILFFREEVKDHLFFIPLISAGLLSAMSEFFLKFLIARPRPYLEMGAIILDVPGNFSFPSTHSMLAFSFAYILSKVENRATILLYLMALLISFSRIYLGVHYVFDVVAGAIIGTLIGMFSQQIQKYWYNRPHETKRKTASHRRI